MKRLTYIALLATMPGIFAGFANAGYVNGQNWADRVDSYTERIQRYGVAGCGGGVLMETNTTWWVLGTNDCDQNGDMDARSEDANDEQTIDNDYVAGWRAANEDQEIVLEFDIGLADVNDANDMVIRMYCGGKAHASVWVSAESNDISNFVKIGDIFGTYDEIPGTPGMLYDAYFDFNGVFTEDVHYIRVYRETTGSDTGMFFDSFASAVAVKPNTCQEVGYYGWSIRSDLYQDCRIDFLDYAVLAGEWQNCNDPNDPNCDHRGFPDPNDPPSLCHGVWQLGFGIGADLNHDCCVDLLDIAVFAGEWLQCNDPNDPNCDPTW
jgi:hypothetical protein